VALDWVCLSTGPGLGPGPLVMRQTLKQVGDRVWGVGSANSHRCCHMSAVHHSGHSSRGPEKLVFVGIVGLQDLRVMSPAGAAGAGTVGARTSTTTVCLCLHCCKYANGIRVLAVDIAVAVAVVAAEAQSCCLRPKRWCWGCPPTQVSDQIGITRSQPSRSCRASRLGLSRILSAGGEDEMA